MWIDGTSRRGAVLVADNILQNNGSGLTVGDFLVTPRPWSGLRLLSNPLSQAPQGIRSSAALQVVPRTSSASIGVDDFHVDGSSAAIDAGTGTAAVWGLDGRTVRRDGAPDEGAVDLGYHYPR